MSLSLALSGGFLALTPLRAGVITSVPGPDEQGGMLMPMVMIMDTSGDPANPTSGMIMMMPDSSESLPLLQSLNVWSPGNWFEESASWRADLSPKTGSVAGMPPENAGNGDLFSNQYGFMFMAMGVPSMANIPDGQSLAIRLDAVSTPNLLAFNYGWLDNRWDLVFSEIDDQVLWNGTMWHLYFTLPEDAAPGIYSATFEIFIADAEFTGNTGFAQYDNTARNAARNSNFTSDFVTLTWEVIPEPSAMFLFGMGLFFTILGRLVLSGHKRNSETCA